MQLTAKNLSELIQSLRSNVPGGSQKRIQPRVGIRLKVELVLLDPKTGFGSERIAAWVRDISAGGIGLLCDRGFKAGEPFDLIVQGEEGAEERVPCFISYCREVGTDLFSIGAKFQDYKPKDADEER